MSVVARRAWFLPLARGYVRRRLARDLDGVWVHGLSAAANCAAAQPLVLAANHVAWWDSFLLVALDEALGTEGFALMDAENVAQLPFFGWAGAVPLLPSRPRAGLEAGAALLGRPGRALWIFPQGAQRPAHFRPLGFLPGIRLLARLAPEAAVVPVAFQYLFREAPAPAAYVHFGAPLPAPLIAGERGPQVLEDAVCAGLQSIDAAAASGQNTFVPLIASRHRAAEQGLGARLLGARSRPAGVE